MSRTSSTPLRSSRPRSFWVCRLCRLSRAPGADGRGRPHHRPRDSSENRRRPWHDHGLPPRQGDQDRPAMSVASCYAFLPAFRLTADGYPRLRGTVSTPSITRSWIFDPLIKGHLSQNLVDTLREIQTALDNGEPLSSSRRRASPFSGNFA